MGWKGKFKEKPFSKGFCSEGKYGENGHKYMNSYNNQNAFIVFYNNKQKK